MKTFMAALLFLLCSSTTAIAQRGSSAVMPPDAATVCTSGAGGPYGHASNACWIAHEEALGRHDEERALAYVKLGCEKYRRSDQCLLVTLAGMESRRGVAMRAAATQRKGPGDVLRATQWLYPADHEDGEAGVIFYDLLRTRVVTRAK